MLKLSFAGATDVGCVRSSNQDAYYIEPNGRFFIVADGMGGHAGGEEASRIATECIRDYINGVWDTDDSPEDILTQAVLKANRAIVEDQIRNPHRADMGTTVVVVMIRNEQAWYSYVGDSRLYRLRGAKLDQISIDHTWIARAVGAGLINPEEARVHPWRHMLLQCVGREDLKFINVFPLDFVKGDRLLICSDGLTEEVSEDRIAYNLRSIRPPESAAQALIAEAKEMGGRDNVTVVIIANERTEV
jgi:serine/threonine protein phosphatase PrpC